jgi:hypothetical protein
LQALWQTYNKTLEISYRTKFDTFIIFQGAVSLVARLGADLEVVPSGRSALPRTGFAGQTASRDRFRAEADFGGGPDQQELGDFK